jgi:hypothetical protein
MAQPYVQEMVAYTIGDAEGTGGHWDDPVQRTICTFYPDDTRDGLHMLMDVWWMACLADFDYARFERTDAITWRWRDREMYTHILNTIQMLYHVM